MSHRVFRLLLVTILMIGLVSVKTPSSARAAGPWYVSNAGDDNNNCLSPSTPCATINAALAKPGFVAGDTIRVSIGTYTGTGNEVVLLDKSATLAGGWDASFTTQSGMSTIDGQGARRGITVISSITTMIERFLIQNGGFSSLGFGGGIYNEGTMIINNTAITGNSAGNVCCSGGGGGGGIVNGGIMILNNSIVSENTILGFFYGSGILNTHFSVITINNSTVSGNTASDAIYNEGLATMTINNSTVSGNSSNGINDQGGTVTVQNSTISANWGGIYTSGSTLTMKNSILAGNTVADCTGTMVSLGYNLIGDTSFCNFTLGSGDLTNIDPLIGSLQDNGGPTFTHTLLPGSPAIDAGNPAGCTDQNGILLSADQRGVARPQGGRCDIGAFELEAENPGMQVSIDIIPGSAINIITIRSAGTVPVAILSTATFNAPAAVNKTSLTFGKTGNEASLSHCLTKQAPDVNGDGRSDLICYFRISMLGLASGDTQAILRGQTLSGTPFEGADSVKVSGSKNH